MRRIDNTDLILHLQQERLYSIPCEVGCLLCQAIIDHKCSDECHTVNGKCVVELVKETTLDGSTEPLYYLMYERDFDDYENDPDSWAELYEKRRQLENDMRPQMKRSKPKRPKKKR